MVNKGKPLAGKSTLNRLDLTPADATTDNPYKNIKGGEFITVPRNTPQQFI